MVVRSIAAPSLRRLWLPEPRSLWTPRLFAGRIRRDGKRIRAADGGRTHNEDCCCVDCTGNTTTADFTFHQTNCTDPFSFAFTDASVADSLCEPIVAWHWSFGDGGTSTDQNPTHTYPDDDPGPWTVTLTVTDSCGCTDAVFMEVEAVYLAGCTCPGGSDFPYVAFLADCVVNISGVTTKTPACSNCITYFNGTHTLTRFGPCTWEKTASWPDEHVGFACTATTWGIHVSYLSGKFTVSLLVGAGSNGSFDTSTIACDDAADYAGALSTTRTAGGLEYCDALSATVTLELPPPIFCDAI